MSFRQKCTPSPARWWGLLRRLDIDLESGTGRTRQNVVGVMAIFRQLTNLTLVPVYYSENCAQN